MKRWRSALICGLLCLGVWLAAEEVRIDQATAGRSGPVWNTQTDADNGGASTSAWKTASDGGRTVIQWDYRLQATARWAWPNAGLHLSRLPLTDLSSWDGLLLTVKASRPGLGLIAGLSVTDSRLRSTKPLGRNIELGTAWTTLKIPFKRMQTLYWWLQQNPSGSGLPDLDQVNGVFLQSLTADGDKATILVAGLSLYRGEADGQLAGEIAGPTQETLDLSAQPAPAGTSAATIRVRPAEAWQAPYTSSQGRINPRFWGSNWAQWVGAFPDPALSAKLNLKLIRVGGNNMSRYNWRNSLYTDAGGTQAKPQPDLESFVAFCRAQGAEPLIQINATGWAPSDKPGHPFEKCLSEKDAADLVTYLNGTKRLGVTYFEIDNEFDIWHETHRDVVKEAVGAKAYTDLFIKYASAMKKAQAAIGSASDIKIIGPVNCTSWIGWKTKKPQDSYGQWDSFPPYFLDACQRYEKTTGLRILDVYSFHFYASFRPDYKDSRRFIPEGIPAMLESAQNWWNPAYVNRYDWGLPKGTAWGLVPRYRKWIAECYPGTELAVTEFNLDAASNIVYPPAVREIWLADVLGAMAKYGLDFALQFALNGDDATMDLLNQDNDLHPSYWIYQLYANNLTGTMVAAESDKPETLNVYASRQDSGDLVVMVVNKDASRDWDARLKIENAAPGALEHRFPKLSLTCIKLPAGSQTAQIQTYGLEQILAKP